MRRDKQRDSLCGVSLRVTRTPPPGAVEVRCNYFCRGTEGRNTRGSGGTQGLRGSRSAAGCQRHSVPPPPCHQAAAVELRPGPRQGSVKGWERRVAASLLRAPVSFLGPGQGRPLSPSGNSHY